MLKERLINRALISFSMSLTEDIRILVERGAHYGLHRDVLAELPHFLHDLVFGASLAPKDPDYLYADLHLHIPRTVSMRRVLDEISPRIDICAIVTREPKYDTDGGYLDFDAAVQKLKMEGIPILTEDEDKRFVKVGSVEHPFYFVRAIEVYGQEGQELVIVGNDKEFRDDRVNDTPLDDLIAEAKDLGSLWFIDHPMSIGAPVISFRYPTLEEEKRLRGWIEKHDPTIETGNHQNTLWMFPSNAAMRRIAREYSCPQITNSDSHFRLQEIGLSRTAIPHRFVNSSFGDAFITSLNEAIRLHPNQIRLESGYSSAFAFGQYMVLPTLLWKAGRYRAARRIRGIQD